jgi:glutamate formiminotransferase/formiminotetrahydrofolate cyclodeaminase
VSASLLDDSCAGLLDRLASSAPTPGGGSAAAWAGATAASLVEMVAIMKKTRTGSDHDRAELHLALATAKGSGERLRALVDEDAHAFDAVLAARRLPHGTAAESASREQAMAAATRRAAEVPLETSRECMAVLGAASMVLAYGNPNAASDARAAGALAWAGLVAAVENVKINLEGQAPTHPALQETELRVREAHERLKAFGFEG